MNNTVSVQHPVRNLRKRFHGCNIHTRMVYEISVLIIDKGISILIQLDIVYHFSHKGIIQLDTDHADKLSVQINGGIIGDHLRVQIVRDIRRKPYRLSRRLGDRKPDQLRGILRVIHGDIRHLMLLKVFSRIDKPEALHILRNRRIDPVVISHDPVGFIQDLFEERIDPIQMCLQLLIIQSVQIRLDICRKRLDILFNADQTRIQILLTCLAEEL